MLLRVILLAAKQSRDTDCYTPSASRLNNTAEGLSTHDTLPDPLHTYSFDTHASPFLNRAGKSEATPFTDKKDVKDRSDENLTTEPEMIRAFRDTWELGVHSYLTYLRNRLYLVRELLKDEAVCLCR